MIEYYYPGVDTSPGALNLAYPIVFEFTGYSIRKWYVERETEKTLFLKRINAKSYDTRRLHKNMFGKVHNWRGELFSYNRDEVIEKAKAHIQKEREALYKLEADIETAIENLGEKP